MSARKYTDDPEGWREEIQDLRTQIKQTETALQNLRSPNQKAIVAANGKNDIAAFTIIRAIYLSKNPHLTSGLKIEGMGEIEKQMWEKVRSTDPLLETEKARILKAVQDFDRAFLQSLIDAMDSCESGRFLNKPEAYQIIISHQTFERMNNGEPTNSQLLQVLNQLFPKLVMDRKTLAFHCKAHSLPLAKAKRGRPIKSGSETQITSF